jgi:hypothetical protein
MGKIMRIYPTKQQLKKIKRLASSCDKVEELIKYISDIWYYYPEYFIYKHNLVLVLHTGGCSGNEEIIQSLQDTIFWALFWYKSIRGGHYYFKIKKLK